MAQTTVELEIGNNTFEFDVEADAEFCRYDGTWCDSPEWVELENVVFYWAGTAKKVSKNFLNFLTAGQMDYVHELLGEAA
jgi:hypothetical protein